MIKTLAAANKSERETFRIPRSVQQSIPIQRVFRDGIWQTGRNKYNRIISFDLYEMGEQLKPTALNVTLETIQNRVAANRLAGKYTWVFVDEVYLFFRYYYSAQFLYKCWKRFRKYAAAMTAATQNVEECLRSDTARLMFARQFEKVIDSLDVI